MQSTTRPTNSKAKQYSATARSATRVHFDSTELDDYLAAENPAQLNSIKNIVKKHFRHAEELIRYLKEFWEKSSPHRNPKGSDEDNKVLLSNLSAAFLDLNNKIALNNFTDDKLNYYKKILKYCKNIVSKRIESLKEFKDPLFAIYNNEQDEKDDTVSLKSMLADIDLIDEDEDDNNNVETSTKGSHRNNNNPVGVSSSYTPGASNTEYELTPADSLVSGIAIDGNNNAAQTSTNTTTTTTTTTIISTNPFASSSDMLIPDENQRIRLDQPRPTQTQTSIETNTNIIEVIQFLGDITTKLITMQGDFEAYVSGTNQMSVTKQLKEIADLLKANDDLFKDPQKFANLKTRVGLYNRFIVALDIYLKALNKQEEKWINDGLIAAKYQMEGISLSDNFLSAIQINYQSVVSKLQARSRYNAVIPLSEIEMEPIAADLHKLVVVLQEKNTSFESYLNNNENFNIGTLNLNLRFVATKIKESEGLLAKVEKSTNPHTVHEYNQFILALENYLQALNTRIEELMEESKDKERAPQAKNGLKEIWMISPYLLSAIKLKLTGKDKIEVSEEKLAKFKKIVNDLTKKQIQLKGLMPEMFENKATSSDVSVGTNGNSFLALKSRSGTNTRNNNNINPVTQDKVVKKNSDKRQTFR